MEMETRREGNGIDRFSTVAEDPQRDRAQGCTVILAFSIMRKLCGSIDLVTRSRDHRLSITRHVARGIETEVIDGSDAAFPISTSDHFTTLPQPKLKYREIDAYKGAQESPMFQRGIKIFN